MPANANFPFHISTRAFFSPYIFRIYHKVIFLGRLGIEKEETSEIASHGPSEFRMGFLSSLLNVIYSINTTQTRTNKKKLKEEMFFLCKVTHYYSQTDFRILPSPREFFLASFMKENL